MAENFGAGVSRVLDPAQSGIVQVVWQQGKPPLDSELNFLQQIAREGDKQIVLRGVPSGWLGNPTNCHEDFVTSPVNSNWLRFGRQRTGEQRSIPWAVVNGWLLPITGTLTGAPPGSPNDSDTWNRITLPPPPTNSGDSRIDYVFLEAWLARVPPNPSTTNKPSSSGLWRYGNVEGGYTFLTDDLQDPALGFETTQRVQVQYRIRVVQGLVGLSSYPDGFDPSVVKAQGAATAATSFVFTNMRQTLGDAGLWRAGDGTSNSLGSVDGYSYAIPLCAVFRRNTVAWDGDPSQNLNGGFNRNPTAIDRTGYKTFSTTPTLSANITAAATTLTLTSVSNIPMPTSPASPVAIQIGDEVLTYSSISGTTATVVRGAYGTKAETHYAGDTVKVLSGRPDGLYSDQIAKTDVLDLRHVVNPNGFDHQTLLKGNLDKLLRGELRSNWKRSGSGPQGPFVFYQDKISGSAAALGVTKLDAPDGFRSIFSDASMQQAIELIANPPPNVGANANIGVNWAYNVTISAQKSATANNFAPLDVLTVPVSQFKNSVAGSDTDQIRFISESVANGSVKLRLDGSASFLTQGVDYTVTTPTDSSDDLVINLLSTFNGSAAAGNAVRMFITIHLQYGPGRGISRRPDSLHSVSYLSANSDILTQQAGVPTDNTPLRTAWAPLWSRYRGGVFNNLLPVTAEAYADLGSKTVILTPYRRMSMPSLAAINGGSLNGGQGLMPIGDISAGAKWGATDPLGLFSGDGDPGAGANTYVILPRRLVPGWGEVRLPILHTDTGTFAEGANFMVQCLKGTFTSSDTIHNIIPHTNGNLSYAAFSTADLSTGGLTASTYNATFSYNTYTFAGIQFFTDDLGLGRKGLQLPPFYGIARLFGVYEAANYKALGSSYNATTRAATGGGATNLLRQNFTGPVFWITLDEDGDSTFVINADAIDLDKSPNAIASFESGKYVVEASIFGFDRGSFDVSGGNSSNNFRLVLSRLRSDATTGTGNVDMPNLVLPAAPMAGDEIVINYSRTPYQGDAWGSQATNIDIGHKPGCLTTATTYQLTSTELDEESLTRPNQKTLEVLASVGFLTTYGSGRISGDMEAGSAFTFDFRNVGYEDFSTFPPTSGVDPRPTQGINGVPTGDRGLALSTQYHNCIERLPLGSLFREKDFHGNFVGGSSATIPGPLVYAEDRTPGVSSNSLGVSSSFEQDELTLASASTSSGQPNEIVVHVDGEQGNYSLLTNYRTNRGGSAFTASGPHPGGELSSVLATVPTGSVYGGVLAGVAYLVRNTVTAVGSTEVSAGGELMMLVATTAQRVNPSTSTTAKVFVGTNGSGEGNSAADLYRIQGHPLLIDRVRIDLDPSTVELPKKTGI